MKDAGQDPRKGVFDSREGLFPFLGLINCYLVVGCDQERYISCTYVISTASTGSLCKGLHYYAYVSGFEKRGHFGADLNFEILICAETVGNQLSFTACFMFIAARIHFLCVFI